MSLIMIYPMFAMFLITLVVAGILFYSRVRGVRTGLDPRHFKTFATGEPTELMTKTSRHFSNIFEVPNLFYIGCILAMIIPITGFWIQVWAWLFVCARALHAAIHIGPNKVYPRVSAYFLCWFALVAIWLEVLLTVTAGLR